MMTLWDAAGTVLPALAMAGWLSILADHDRRTGRIPNRWVIPTVIGTLAVTPLVPAAAISGAVLAFPYVVGAAVRACGCGDAKLAFACGGVVGDPASTAVVMLLAGLLTVVHCWVKKRSRVAHGPALVAASVLLMLLK